MDHSGDLTWDEAHDACCALNAGGLCTGNGGWRLCDSNTWQTACTSTTGSCFARNACASATDRSITPPTGTASGMLTTP